MKKGEKNLKKSLLLLLSILLVSAVFLAACGKSNNNASTTNNNTSTTTPSSSQPSGGNDSTGGPTPAEEPEQLGFIKATDPSRIPAASKARTDTIIIGMNNTSGIFSPFFYETAYDSYVIDVIFEGLTQVTQDGSLAPGLATWETSEDGLVWTFHLDPNAKFSDGTPVTAYDAEFSYYVYADPNYDGRSNYSVAKIKGFEEYKNGNATTIEGIKVIDDHTLQVTVDEVNALTLAYLGVTVAPKHYYGDGFSKGKIDVVKAKNSKPMGSGPFVFKDYIPGQEVRLEANTNYYKQDEIPKIKNLIFKATTSETNIAMLEAGETDFEEGISVSKDTVELLKSMGFVDISLLLNNGYGYIAINHDVAKFQDKRVRQALTYGLDRESVVFAYSQGYAQVIDVPQSKLSWAYPDESLVKHYEFNPEKAAQLLDEAGWVMGSDGYRYKDGEKFTISFLASTPNAVNDALIPIATENYKALGIEFIAEPMEFGTLVERIGNGDYEMGFLAVGLSAVDPDPFGLFHTNGGSNNYNYSNPEVDRLIEQGQKELDIEKRKAIYSELYQILNEEVPVVLMYQRYNMNVINSRIQGFEITPYYDFTASLNQVYIAQ